MQLANKIKQMEKQLNVDSDICRCAGEGLPQFKILPGVWERKDCTSFTDYSPCLQCGKQQSTLYFTLAIGNAVLTESAGEGLI